MPYTSHFSHADDIISHLDTIVPGLTDPLLKAKYVGFVAIAGATVYELAIKEIFIAFGEKKHKVLGEFTRSYFYRINGRIRLSDLRDKHIKNFGEKYTKRFERKLTQCEKNYLATHRRNIRSSYGNLISERHHFAHEGILKTNATYTEMVENYKDGKEVIRCLFETMVR